MTVGYMKPVTHLPCLSCSSSDAMTYYPEDGHSFCFSCSSWFGKDSEEEIKKIVVDKQQTKVYTNIKKVTIRDNMSYVEVPVPLPYRGITKATLEKFKVKTYTFNSEPVIVYPTSENAGKVRSLREKKFWTEGDYSSSPMFGMNCFDAGSAKAITITEGENDAMSVYEMMGGYPCVSVKTGAKGAAKDCAENRDYINSFERIYLCFDNDDKGREATVAVARLFDCNKVYIVEMTKFKDANEYLTKGAAKDFVKVWWGAQRFKPKGIISSFEEIDSILDKEEPDAVANFPFPTLEEMSLGIRFAEVNLITAETGVGKTEFIRAIEYAILKETDYNIGIIHLEEREKRAIQGLATYELGTPVHRSSSGVSRAEVKEAFKQLVKREDRAYFYQHFGSEDPDVILDIIRHLVTANHCKFIFLDHITMLVTGYEGDDERKRLDYLSTRLAVLTRELDFTLFLVSHVNDDGRTRGSRNIEKIADLWLHVHRDKEAADPDKRNTMTVMVKKNRFAGETGPAGFLKFSPETYKLTEEIVPDGAAIDARISDEGKSVEEPGFLGEQTVRKVENVLAMPTPSPSQHHATEEDVAPAF